MSTVFRLDASIRNEGSVSRAVASTLETALTEDLGGATVIRREIGLTPLDSKAWALSAFSRYVPVEQRSPEQTEAIALATTLADELVAADAHVFAVPLYNWGVSQHVKAWFDLIMTDPRVRAPEPLLQGKPVVLAAVRGGGYAPGTPKHGWDHSTPYLVRMLGDLWGADLTVVERELTLAAVNPAMEPLRPLAEQLHAAALEAAQAAGKALGVAPAEV